MPGSDFRMIAFYHGQVNSTGANIVAKGCSEMRWISPAFDTHETLDPGRPS